MFYITLTQPWPRFPMMRFFVLLTLLLLTICLVSVSGTFDSSLLLQLQLPHKQPLAFVPDRGQTNNNLRFQAHWGGQTLFFGANEILYSWIDTSQKIEISSLISKEKPVMLRQQFVGANEGARLAAADPLIGQVNYFLGNDPSRWRTNLPTYATLSVTDLYPGIEMIYRGQEETLNITWVVQPQADLNQVRWHYKGVTTVNQDEGQLYLKPIGSDDTLVIKAPLAWQWNDGKLILISTRYFQQLDGSVSLKADDFDASLPLNVTVFMPLLNYAQDWVYDVYTDSNDYIFVSGTTSAIDFPTANPFQATLSGSYDAFVTKFSLDGTEVLFSTFIGGSSGEGAKSVTVDENGYIYLTGSTDSQDFPLQNPIQGSLSGFQDIFVMKLQPDGSQPLYSTYWGGSNGDTAAKIMHDADGNAYVVGSTWSQDFPLVNPLQAINRGRYDTFVSKISSDGQAAIFSTYLGGNHDDIANSMTMNEQGDIFIVGRTHSVDFPLLNPIQANYSGLGDVFVSQLESDGQGLIYSTFIGGSQKDEGKDITIHQDGTVSVIGQTYSSGFPLVNPFQSIMNGSADFFVTHIAESGSSLLYSTYLGGGSAQDVGMGIEVDEIGNYFVTGTTESADFPLEDPIQATYADYQDIVVAKIDRSGTHLLFSTYLGGEAMEFVLGSALDSEANIYIVGGTYSTSFPTTPGAWQTVYHGGGDGFVTKISEDGSVFDYSTYLGGGFPTDVTVVNLGHAGANKEAVKVFLASLFVLFVCAGFLLRRYQSR